MEIKITSKDFEVAEKRLSELLNIATQRGGFKFLTSEELKELKEVTLIVKLYEDGISEGDLLKRLY